MARDWKQRRPEWVMTDLTPQERAWKAYLGAKGPKGSYPTPTADFRAGYEAAGAERDRLAGRVGELETALAEVDEKAIYDLNRRLQQATDRIKELEDAKD